MPGAGAQAASLEQCVFGAQPSGRTEDVRLEEHQNDHERREHEAGVSSFLCICGKVVAKGAKGPTKKRCKLKGPHFHAAAIIQNVRLPPTRSKPGRKPRQLATLADGKIQFPLLLATKLRRHCGHAAEAWRRRRGQAAMAWQ